MVTTEPVLARFGQRVGVPGDATLRVRFLSLTDVEASEHVYMSELREALRPHGVTVVENWRDADVVHLFEVNLLTRDTLTAFRVPTVLRVMRSQTPMVVSTDDLYFTDRPELTAHPALYGVNHHLQRALLRRADAVIAISQSVKETLLGDLPKENLAVVHHGVGEPFHDGGDRSDRERYILHVSQAAKRKNPEAVLAVARTLDERMILVGRGWANRVSDALRATGIETPGYVTSERLAALYRRAMAFYFPTRHEGFGLPLLEAMASGTPVVTTDVYAVPEVVGDAAIRHPPDAIESHQRSLRELLDSPRPWIRYHRRGLARAAEFTWPDAAAQTRSVYRTVVNQSG